MSAAQLQELMAQVQQLTLVNNKLQQELSSNSDHIARLETAMHQRRGRSRDADAGQSWSRSSSNRSSRSGDSQHHPPPPTSTEISSSVMAHGGLRKDSNSSTGVQMVPHPQDTSGGGGGSDSRAGSNPLVGGPQRSNDNIERQWQAGAENIRERRDSGSCDHTESEIDGRVCRDVATNTPSAHEVHFDQLAAQDEQVGPGVVSSDSEGNERITIGTQTTEVLRPADLEPQHITENVRGCSKAATPQQLADFYHGAWPIVDGDVGALRAHTDGLETRSVMSFHSSISSHSSRPSYHHKAEPPHKPPYQPPPPPEPIALQPPPGNQPLGSKVQMVYSLLSMLGTHDPEEVSHTLLAMSSSPDSCAAMRQSGCLPLLVQLIYGNATEAEVAGRVCRARACKALHNIIHSPSDDQRNRREIKILKYLEIVQAHCEHIREDEMVDSTVYAAAEAIWPPPDMDRNPGPAIAALMKLSFDDYSRQPICALGGLQCMAQLIKFDQKSYSASSDIQRITMRRYACMTLTNLTFGDSINKARLCAMQGCLDAIVHQLQAFNEDLCQVAASVIRNLSWRADQTSKQHLRISQAATKLMITSIQVSKESTLKSILSALWNLSAHCTHNKTSICEVDGSIEFLVKMLTYQSPAKTLAIVECAGGILRNISSVIAMREDYRQILRDHGALETLLTHLKSPSLAIVGNACGALWNISARCPEDQQFLLDHGAISMLKNLTTSKHRLINLGSSATIKNLLQYRTELTGGKKPGSSKGRRDTGDSITSHDLKHENTPASPSKNISPSNITTPGGEYPHGNTGRVHRTDSQDSVGSCSSLTNREGLTTLSKIEQIMQQVIQTNMEIHQLKKVTTSTHSSDTRINSGSSTPRGSKGTNTAASQSASSAGYQQLMSKSSDYPGASGAGAAGTAGLTGSQGQLSNRQSGGGGNTALSPRVNHKQRQHFGSGSGSSGANQSSAAVQQQQQGQIFYPALASLGGNPGANTDDRFSVRSNSSSTDDTGASPHANYSMTYNDDNIDNTSEKPVDYSQRYQESNGSIYGGVNHSMLSSSMRGSAEQQGANVTQQMTADYQGMMSAAGSGFMTSHDPAMLLQNSQGSFLDPSYFDIPTLDQIKAQAMMPPTVQSQPISQQTSGTSRIQGGATSTRVAAMNADLSRLEEHHGEDQVRTFCTEGTPMNFLSTATSMNELNKIGDDCIPERDEQSITSSHTSKSHTTQDSVKSNPAYTPAQIPEPNQGSEGEAEPVTDRREPLRLPTHHEEDEPPRTYATEDTPITGISRVSSLSSLTSAVDGRSTMSGGDGSTSRDIPPISLPTQGGLERIQENEVLSPASTQPSKTNKSTTEQKTVSFDEHAHVQETPMMFSRASSLASLSSCDQQSIHSSVFSDYSRRASQVVSPSDLPDSPGDTSPVSKRKNKQQEQTGADKSIDSKPQPLRTESRTPPLPHPDSLSSNHMQGIPQQQLNQQLGQQQRTNHDQYHQQPTNLVGPVHRHNASGNAEAVSNLLGLSGQFGSLSGLASLQGPEIPDNDEEPQTFSQPPQQIQQQQYTGQPVIGTPTNYYYQQQQQYHPQYNMQQHQHNMYTAGYMPPNIASVTPMMHHQHPVGFQHQTTPNTPYSQTPQQFRHMTPQSAIVRPMTPVTPQQQQVRHNITNTPVRPGILRPTPQLSGQMGPQTTNPSTGAKPQDAMSRSQDVINKPPSTTASNTKVDQFLSDTVRTYAVEGTPGPNSSRSSLSALTFLDDGDVASPGLQLLKSSLTKSRESVLSASKSSHALLESQRRPQHQGQKTPEISPGKPLDLSMKTKSEPVDVEDAPPLPPKPVHLGTGTIKRRSNSSSSLTSPSPSSSDKSPATGTPTTGTPTTPAAASAGTTGASSAGGGTKKGKTRSRAASESKNESDDSSSDGDDIMLQQCINSAMPMSKKMPKSSSDGAVSASAAGSKVTGRVVPRSKTFGSKLRMTSSKKSAKAAQLAKQRQAPPIVSANSPTPDDDYFAEETVMAYCTEDTPYNKSTATSLSDLSVIDDDAVFAIKSDFDDEVLDNVNPESDAHTIEIGDAPELDVRGDAGAKSTSSSSLSSDDEASTSMLSNAIFSALPKKSGAKPTQPVVAAVTPVVDHRSLPNSEPARLRLTGNEIRATDIKFQTSADSIRNYATEGTPNNFSTNTSLSDLTIESHYSTNKPPQLGNQFAGRAAARVIPGAGGPKSQSKPSSAQSSPSRQASLLPRRQLPALPAGQATPTKQNRPQAASSPFMQRGSTPAGAVGAGGKPGSASASASAECDEMKSFGVEGTPFNYSRRESLSSLSCDDSDEDAELNITIINRVNAAMMKRMQDNKAAANQNRAASADRKIAASPASAAATAVAKAGDSSPVLRRERADRTDKELMPPPPSLPQMVVRDGVIKKFTLPPPSDGFQSRDEMAKAYTPIEGTPYCFSRNSPLSSLSSGSDSEEDEPGLGEDAKKSNIATIAEAHQAEGGKSSVSSDSDSDDNSQGSLASSHAFLDHCISSALPKKTSTLPRPTAKTSGATGTKQDEEKTAVVITPQKKTTPPKVLPKPKPKPVKLLPANGQMVVSQRTPSRGMSTETSTDSLKTDNMPSTYKQTENDNRVCGTRELRRRTYTVTESEIQTAISLIPTAASSPSMTTISSELLNEYIAIRSFKSSDSESNIVISGDEDDFDDVFMLENGELVKHDVDAILAALKDASELEKSVDLLDLPEPPLCFSDSYTTDHSEVEDHVSEPIQPKVEFVKRETDWDKNNCMSGEQEKEDTDKFVESPVTPVVRKGPCIAKPDISKSESIQEFEKNEAKVVRGKRKPLYPGKKIIAGRQAISAANNVPSTVNNKNDGRNTKVTSNSKKITKPTKTFVSPEKKSISTKIGSPSKNSPNQNGTAVVKTGATSNIAKPTSSKLPTAKGRTQRGALKIQKPVTPTQNNNSSNITKDKTNISKASNTLNKNADKPNRGVILKPVVTPQRSSSLTKPPASTVKRSIAQRPSSVPACKSETGGRGTAVTRKTRPGIVLPGVRMCADGAEVDGEIVARGRTVSSRAVLHRAADSSKSSSRNSSPGPKKVTQPVSQPTSGGITIAKPTSTSAIKARIVPGSNVNKPTTKPKAVSKIASLWKSPAGGGTTGASSPQTQKITPTKSSSASKTTNLKTGNVPDYVVAISFREPKNSTRALASHSIDCGGDQQKENDKQMSLETLCSIENASLLSQAAEKKKESPSPVAGISLREEFNNKCENESATTQDEVKKDKTSARITPFLHKPEQKSAPVFGHSKDSNSHNFTSQTKFYNGHDSQHITVRLDIKPCITVSDIPPSHNEIDIHDAEPLQLDSAVNTKQCKSSIPGTSQILQDESDPKSSCDSPSSQKSKSVVSSLKDTDLAKPTASPPMTKTEMLLRRRSEILKRRESESSANSVESSSSSSPRYTMTKTTEV